MNDLKLKFYKVANRFFEAGYMKEIYTCDEFSLCNVADDFYAVFPFVALEHGENNCFGFTMPIDKLEFATEYNKSIYVYYANIDNETKKRSTLLLNDKAFSIMGSTVARTSKIGPSRFIDREFERRINNVEKKGFRR